jgi:hypothetical protein
MTTFMYIFLCLYTHCMASERATTHFMILDLKYQLHITIKQLCGERELAITIKMRYLLDSLCDDDDRECVYCVW